MSNKIKLLIILPILALLCSVFIISGYAISNQNFEVEGNIVYEPINLSPPYYQEDEYYYIDMGSYGGAPIKWKLVGYNNNGILTKYNVAQGLQTTLGVGVFVQETYVDVEASNNQVFLADGKYSEDNKNHLDDPDLFNVFGNDYSTSDIRNYIKTKIEDDYNLKNDKTYQIVKNYSRTLEDLYSNMLKTGEKLDYPTDKGVPDKKDKDPLWLLSYNEIEIFYSSNNERIYAKDNSTGEGKAYWTRSSNLPYHDSVFEVETDGGFFEGDIYVSLPRCFPFCTVKRFEMNVNKKIAKRLGLRVAFHFALE